MVNEKFWGKYFRVCKRGGKNFMVYEKESLFNNLAFLVRCARIFYNFFNLERVESKEERQTFTNIWYNIWLKEGYATHEESILEKKKVYEKVSKDFLIKFLFLPIGTIRIIFNEDVEFPIINNFEIQRDFDNEKVVELSLFSIRKFFRFSHVSSLIAIKKIYKLLKKERITGFLAALDRRLYIFLKERLQIPLYKIGKEKIYEGSLTYPVYLNLREAEEFLRANNYQIYKFFIL
ncbi:MAG: hypothetical protein QW156_04280 [Candidatus Aenigmatarchaeota archaeon]